MNTFTQFTRRIVAAVAMILCTSALWAYDFKVDGIYYNITSETDLTVSVTYQGSYFGSYKEYSGEVVIPSTVNYNGKTYSVTSIEDNAFRSCTDLTSITISENVTSIGGATFDGCTGLTSVKIPSSVTSIEGSAFNNCSNLTAVYISDIKAWCGVEFPKSPNNTANPLYYAKNLYINDELVTDLVIPDGVTSIGNYAFHNCTNLTSVTIPNSITSIGILSFQGCSGLKAVHISDLKAWCEINSESNLLSASKKLYLNNELVTGDLVIPSGTTSIGNYAFYCCTELTSITIPNSVTSIGNHAFYSCYGLTTISIPNSVISIGQAAFHSCI